MCNTYATFGHTNTTNSMDKIIEIVDKIRLERLKQRISQEKMAKLIGVERHTIISNEKKGANPKISILVAQAKVLGLEIKIGESNED